METNVSKAMIMAGGVLLGVLIITAFVYIIHTGASLNENFERTQGKQLLDFYNSQFMQFDRQVTVDTDPNRPSLFITKGNTASDVVSAVNLAYDFNKNFGYDTVQRVNVYIYNGASVVYNLTSNNQAIKNTLFKGNTQNPDNVISISDFLRLDGASMDPSHSIDHIITESKTASNGEVLYRYYFDCDAIPNPSTGRIWQLNFKKVEITNYETDF